VNGRFAGGWPYGYASWRVDLTPFVRFGADNVIAIRLDNPPNSRAGIRAAAFIGTSGSSNRTGAHRALGTYVTTPEISAKVATVNILVNVDNEMNADSAVTVRMKFSNSPRMATGGNPSHHSPPPVSKLPPASPNRTWAKSSFPIRNCGASSHRNAMSLSLPLNSLANWWTAMKHPFGIRTIQFTSDNGFLLNGRRVPLNGVCDHHDLGALGAAINIRALGTAG